MSRIKLKGREVAIVTLFGDGGMGGDFQRQNMCRFQYCTVVYCTVLYPNTEREFDKKKIKDAHHRTSISKEDRFLLSLEFAPFPNWLAGICSIPQLISWNFLHSPTGYLEFAPFPN